jgi:DNA-binding CsgD family transcriptional regulator
MDRPLTIRRQAFEFVESLDRLASVREIMDAMERAVGWYGFEYFCCGFIAPTANEHAGDILLADKFPDGWVQHYVENDYVNDDPGLRQCKTTVRPFRWIKETVYDHQRELRAAEVLERAWDWGLKDGLMIPVTSPGGRIGQVFFGGHEFDLAPDELRALHFMALYAFDRALQLSGRPDVPQLALTKREREVLTLVASGKTGEQIGEMLHITARTVVEHIKHCCRRLGAANRTHAVVIAIRDGIIQP